MAWLHCSLTAVLALSAVMVVANPSDAESDMPSQQANLSIVVAPEENGRQRSGTSAIAANGQAAPIHASRAADGLFYVTARINGADMRFMVDTGASVTVISPEEAARIGVVADGRAPGTLRTAAGPTALKWGRIRHAEIGGRSLDGLDVAVVAHGAPAPLLGQNALAQLGTVILRQDTLEID